MSSNTPSNTKLITYKEDEEDLDALIKRIRELSSPKKRKLTDLVQGVGPIQVAEDEEIKSSEKKLPNTKTADQQTSESKSAESGKKKAHYTEEEKKEALTIAAQKRNFNYASKIMREKYGKKYDESSIREWSEFYDNFFRELMNEHRHKKREIDKTSPYRNMEQELIAWIRTERSKNIALKRYDIQKIAKDISGDSGFLASDGWFNRFCKRWGLRKRMPTHQIQKLKEDSWSNVVNFFEDIRRERVKVEILRSLSDHNKRIFINMDEIALQFDTVGHTYYFRGKKEINVLANSAKKRRFTVALTICSDGQCFPPMVIFKGRAPLSNSLKTRFDGSVLLTLNHSGWMSNEKMLLWINKILLNFKREQRTKYYVVLDHFSAHISASTRGYLEKHGFGLFVIPAGFTGLIQPLDTCINHPLKSRLRAKYNSWLTAFAQTGDKNDIHPPSYHVVKKLLGRNPLIVAL